MQQTLNDISATIWGQKLNPSSSGGKYQNNIRSIMTEVELYKMEPKYGWKSSFNHKFEKCTHVQVPNFKQVWNYIGLSLRYLPLYLKKKREGKRIIMDQFDMVPHRPIYGVPLGGLGGGTIGRGFRGEFCRYHMTPGIYEYKTVLANQFTVVIQRNNTTTYHQVLSAEWPNSRSLSSWMWGFPPNAATYTGLYPRSWTTYTLPGQNVTLTCRQVSPFIPSNYKDSSLPCSVFVWEVENHSNDDLDVSLCFTFSSGTGSKKPDGSVTTKAFRDDGHERKVAGVEILQKKKDLPLSYCIVAEAVGEGSSVSHCAFFDPRGTGTEIQKPLMNNACLPSDIGEHGPTAKGREAGVAVCARIHVPAGQRSTVRFALCWLAPEIQFRSKGKTYKRRYTEFFGSSLNAGPEVCRYALEHCDDWEKAIHDWQEPTLEDSSLPEWYKSVIFNEMYYLSDGGTLWLCGEDDDPPLVREYGRFAYLEGHEYRMYNTYDVHFYASFALISLWPKLQLSLQYDFAKAVDGNDEERIKFLMTGKKSERNISGAVPHDLGDPEEEPWLKVNAYNIHQTADWKDLNCKFVLQVYRDYCYSHDLTFLKDMYPRIKAVMEYAMQFDKDGDGLIENSGYADQTYDQWPATGASAYTGGLWIGALWCSARAAHELGLHADSEHYQTLAEKAAKSYDEKLWNGEFYEYDVRSRTQSRHSVMSDQLAGRLYMRACGAHPDELFPSTHVRKALETIYRCNVQSVDGGRRGAVNAALLRGGADTKTLQSEEIWTGSTYCVAALMVFEGMREEGLKTASGVYESCWRRFGLQYQTPEALMARFPVFRSLGYMRPLCAWAMQHALKPIELQA